MALSEAEQQTILTEWLDRLSSLVASVEGWARELGWSTRRIDKQMEDSQLGDYVAPALIFQEDFTRVLLEPIGRFAPGTEGVVDLYQMPAYDDIVSLFFYDGGWHLHYQPRESSAVAEVYDDVVQPLSKEAFRGVLEQMTKHAT